MNLVTFILSSLTVTLAMVAVAVPVARRIALPLPVAIAAIGLAYGLVTALADIQISDKALDAYDFWFLQRFALDSDALLAVFLPPLLFEMAIAVNVRRMMDDNPTVVLMAVFAVLTATAMVGLAVWLASSLGLVACLLLGAAVSTTDPSAVVATFKEVGAPRRLMVILEGESLLNDAAAIALFTLLVGLTATQSGIGIGAPVLDFLYSFAVGAATGAGVALICGWIYPLLERSAVAQTSITLALAYGSYLLADSLFDASGVVAVVFAGLVTGTIGFISMGLGNWRVAQTVWAQIGFWASTFILLIVASLTPGLLLTLTWQQALLAPLIYVGALLARALMLYLGLPVLRQLGLAEPMDGAQKTLVLWGGVRGAVTLILALTLSHMSELGEEARVVGALAAAYTLMTLFINASTLALATRLLGLDRLSPGDLALRERIVAGAIHRVRKVIADLGNERQIDPEVLEAVEASLDAQHREAEAQASGQSIPFGERLRIGLTILSGQERRLVLRAFDEGAIGPRATNALRLGVERLGDAARIGGRSGYEIASDAHLRSSKGYSLRLALRRYLAWDRPLRRLIEIRVSTLLESERIIRQLDAFAEKTVEEMIGADAAENLRELLAWRLGRVREEIEFIRLQYPDYLDGLERALVSRAALRRERHEYDRLFNDGVIERELYYHLYAELDERERDLAALPRLDLNLSPQALLDRVPLFQGLNERQQRLVAKRLKALFVVPDQVLLRSGDRTDGLYFIASGVLEVRGGTHRRRLSNGSFFGQSLLTNPSRRRSSSIVSVSFARLLRLTRRDLSRLTAQEPAIESVLRAALPNRKLHLNEESEPEVAHGKRNRSDS
ncbi:MAG: cation:proton antiporter [Rhodospirillales bacterium]|nr:cation:proton antiporter [Rhodospirillales bacterium]